MKNILIYGDSIVWGRIPGSTERHGFEDRWTSVFSKSIGDDYRVFVEGLRGRMLKGESPKFPDRNGLEQFGPIFGSHLPVGHVLITSSVNDYLTGSIDAGYFEYVQLALQEYAIQINKWCEDLDMPIPKLWYIAPSRTKSDDIPRDLDHAYAEFVSAGESVCPGRVIDMTDFCGSYFDDLHLTVEDNIAYGEKVAKVFLSKFL